jgi:enoyl-CoA hydratase
MSEAGEVIIRREGAVGRISLNRPEALHSLTLAMCEAMIEALLAWRDDPAVELILIDHAQGRGFCAGGDIRALVDSVAGDGVLANRFFHTEYRLDHLLFTYPKPTVSIIDGIVMGGGVGVSVPAHYRVATERTTFAMPEAGIGLVPDVGGGWYLSRLPGRIGLWLAMTGSRIKAADSLLVGIATDYVEAARLDELKAAIIADPAGIERVLTEFESDEGRPPLAEHEDEINRLFAADDLAALVENLRAGSDWAKAQLAVMETKSPMMLATAFRQYFEGGRMQRFAHVLAMEYRLTVRAVHRWDFTEGVRATVIDKDGAPKWDPPTLAGVTPAMLDEIFSRLPDDQEWTPLPQTADAVDDQWGLCA